MKPNPVILLIDAEKQARRLLRAVLEPRRYKVIETDTGETGIKRAAAARPDMIILDLHLPDIDGLAVVKRLREWYRNPVLVLSALNDEERKVAALDSGANDYITKPFGTDEFLARLRVLQRAHPGDAAGPFYIHGGVQADATGHVATLDGRKIEFTPTEEALFYTLVCHAGKVVSFKHLLRSVWGTDSDKRLHDLHVYIRLLRQKLQGEAGKTLIETSGVGYRLVVPGDSPTTASEPVDVPAKGALTSPASFQNEQPEIIKQN